MTMTMTTAMPTITITARLTARPIAAMPIATRLMAGMRIPAMLTAAVTGITRRLTGTAGCFSQRSS